MTIKRPFITKGRKVFAVPPFFPLHAYADQGRLNALTGLSVPAYYYTAVIFQPKNSRTTFTPSPAGSFSPSRDCAGTRSLLAGKFAHARGYCFSPSFVSNFGEIRARHARGYSFRSSSWFSRFCFYFTNNILIKEPFVKEFKTYTRPRFEIEWYWLSRR